MKFLCLNINNGYNYRMGSADIADQLQGDYQFDKWMRNFKWWRSIFGWVPSLNDQFLLGLLLLL